MAGFSIKKDFAFSASHQLAGLAADHPCTRLHGHNYIVAVELSGELNDVGFVQDYRELEPMKKWIDDTLDHKHLNDIFSFNPTAENMARFIYDLFIKEFPLITSIAISETPKTWATYAN
ncbi:MAG: 6-carboxytetrahydropterin synthase QueD [Methylovulum sp.]